MQNSFDIAKINISILNNLFSVFQQLLDPFF